MLKNANVAFSTLSDALTDSDARDWIVVKCYNPNKFFEGVEGVKVVTDDYNVFEAETGCTLFVVTRTVYRMHRRSLYNALIAL